LHGIADVYCDGVGLKYMDTTWTYRDWNGIGGKWFAPVERKKESCRSTGKAAKDAMTDKSDHVEIGSCTH
jgi:hypothetical protein